MTDAEQHRSNCRIDCEDCQAGPDRENIRITSVSRDLNLTEIWHTPQCPDYMIQQILREAGAEKIKEQDARAEDTFHSAHQRLRDAAATVPADNPAAPFIVALMELLQAQADDPTRFVGLPKWAEILDRHFPQQEDPA